MHACTMALVSKSPCYIHPLFTSLCWKRGQKDFDYLKYYFKSEEKRDEEGEVEMHNEKKD